MGWWATTLTTGEKWLFPPFLELKQVIDSIPFSGHMYVHTDLRTTVFVISIANCMCQR